MELYLPGKKRKYLYKMTQKAKNIYILFKEIGYTGELTKSQKLIGVNNCSRTHDLPAESESKKSPDVRINTLFTFQTLKNQTNV